MAAFKRFDAAAFFQKLDKGPAASAASAAYRHKSPKFAAVAASAAGVEKKNCARNASDWQCFYDERAAFLEHDRKLDRHEAKRQAYEATVIQWLNSNPPQNLDDNYCAHCNKPVGRIGQDAVPFLSGDSGHAWLHHDCHSAWVTRRRHEAVDALHAIGIAS